MLEQAGTGLRCQRVAGPPHSLHHLSVHSWSRPQPAVSLHLRATLSRATAQHLSSVSYTDEPTPNLVHVWMGRANASVTSSLASPVKQFDCESYYPGSLSVGAVGELPPPYHRCQHESDLHCFVICSWEQFELKYLERIFIGSWKIKTAGLKSPDQIAAADTWIYICF